MAITTIKRFGIAFVICLVLSSALKIATAAIPEEMIHDSAVRSASILAAEGDSCKLMVGDDAAQLDNYTTAIMIKMCASRHASGLGAAFGDYHFVDSDAKQSQQTESLQMQLSGAADKSDAGWHSYARYWNGHIAVIKPLLLITDLYGIRKLFALIAVLLLLAGACLIARLRGVLAGVLFGLPFFIVNFQVAAVSPSLSFVFFIALGGTLFVLLTLARKRPHEALWWGMPFFVFGALTSFFDFLCTPIITLGVPLAILVFAGERDSLGVSASIRRIAALVVVATVSWLLGYGMLWVSKLIISSLVLGIDVVGDALSAFRFRVGTTLGTDTSLTPYSALCRNSELLFPGAMRTFIEIFVLASIAFVIAQRKRFTPEALCVFGALMAIALLPYLWYSFVPNHSVIHYWFTYRAQVVSLIGFFLGLATLLSSSAANTASHAKLQSDTDIHLPHGFE